MSIHHLNLRDLSYLCAVAEHRHFGKAADACAISQPAMSERIRRTEDALGTPVFERTKRKVLVTAKGAQIVTLAQSILDTADSIDNAARGGELPLVGRLNLGIISTLGPYLMPYLLRPLKRGYPDLDLRLTEGMTDPLLDALSSGTLDLVLGALPFDRDNIRAEPVFFEPFWLAAPKGHPITKRSPVPKRAVHADEMILLQEGHCLSGQILDACPARRRRDEQRLSATSLETLRHMIASGSRYSLLPDLAVGKAPPIRHLIEYLPLEDEHVGRTIAFFSRNTDRSKSNISALVQTIQKNLPIGPRAITK